MVIGIMDVDFNDFFNNLVVEVKRVRLSSMIDDVYFFVRVVIEVGMISISKINLFVLNYYSKLNNLLFIIYYFFCFICR